MQAKLAASNADALSVKARADALVGGTFPSYIFTGATNANPVEFTIVGSVPFSQMNLNIGGGTGNWAPVNFLSKNTRITAIRTGTHTFTIPIDSTGFGTFAGQTLGVFPFEVTPAGATIDFAGYDYQGFGWGDLRTLGLMYQLTANAAYATKARELLRFIASIGVAGIIAPEEIDTGFPSRSAVMNLVCGYDYCYAALTTQEKADIVTTLNLWYDWYKSNAIFRDGPAESNYFEGHLLGFGLGGLATVGNNARAAEITAHIRGLFDTLVVPSFTQSGFQTGAFRGGFPIESYTYGSSDFTDYLFPYMTGIKSATGEDVGIVPFAKKVAKSLIYNLKPNRWQATDEADNAGSYVGLVQPTFPGYFSYLLEGTTEGGWMQHMYTNMATSPYGGQVDDDFARLHFRNPARADIDYRTTEPTFYYSPGDDHMLWRSNWTDTAVWAQMMGGVTNFVQHQSRNAGNVEIQRGSDYFLVNSGQWKGVNGVVEDGVGPTTFSLVGWRTNTLFHSDGGVYNYSGTNYIGGQGFWGGHNTIVAQQGGTDFAYMKADLTGGYFNQDFGVGNHSLATYVRSICMQGSGVVVVFDRATLTNTGYTDKFLWHINPTATTTLAGGIVKSVLGSSVMFMKPLLPNNPVIVTAPDPQNDDLSGPTVMTRYEVSDPTPTTTLYGLHAFFVGPSSVTSMPTTTKIISTGNTMFGCSVVDGSTTWVNMFAAAGDAATLASITYAATIASSTEGRHTIADLASGVLYKISQNSILIAARVPSTQGLLTFSSVGGGTFLIEQQTSAPVDPNGRTTALISPTNGETFIANGSTTTIRFTGSAKDPLAFSGTPAEAAEKLDFFVDDTIVLTVLKSSAEGFVFKGFAAAVGVGTHVVWARATFASPATTLDTIPFSITVSPAPAYGSTIMLSADLVTSGAYSLVGTAGSRIKVNGGGHQINGSPTSATFQYVDFYDVGDRTATSSFAVDVTTIGALVVDNCRFFDSDTVKFTQNGTSAGTITNNQFSSNMRIPLGSTPDEFGGVHSSFPVLVMAGSSSGAKVFQGNNGGAGWWAFKSPNWTVGGTTAATTNIAIGPRIGIYTHPGFTGTISKNYTRHVYYGGWSQGSNIELNGLSGSDLGTNVLLEHNIVVGSSWPVRGVGGEVRYNLVMGGGGEEGDFWLTPGSVTAFIHHNITWGWMNVSRGAVYDAFGASTNARIENNTFDTFDAATASAPIVFFGGAATGAKVKSNVFLRANNANVVLIGGSATVTADFNAFYQNTGAHYSDGRGTPAHDFTGNPLLTAPPTTFLPYDEVDVWNRVLSVPSILSTFRGYYTPAVGSPLIDAGDTTTFGAGNDIGAVGAGTNNIFDKFGL